MRMSGWKGKSIVVIGAARQGTALARYLARKGARVTLTDRRPAGELLEVQKALADEAVEWVLGGHPYHLLDSADLLCLSGGVPLNNPLVVEAVRRGIPLSNDSQIFLEEAPCKVIGITGSAGKTTVTTLLGRMASVALDSRNGPGLTGGEMISGGRAWVGGNIGKPLIASIGEMRAGDLAIMELSSFQLEIMTRSPQVAALLNITPNHLDRHGNMETYISAKARILDFQSRKDFAVLGRDDPGAWSLAGRVKGRLLSFGTGQLPAGQEGTFLGPDRQKVLLRCNTSGKYQEIELLSRQEITLRGEHNLLNVLAACAIAAAAGLPAQACREGATGFSGVSHRLEFVRSWGGADWYNDSIATAPERAMAAIRSFDEPLVLLAGGRDKDLPWFDFADLARERVDHLILFGEAAGKIYQAVRPGPHTADLEIIRCTNLAEAVQAASKVVSPGDVVLLSPGGTSFDEFRDFEERGEAFRKWVMELE
jgi:UDP-N-acetylmuramoylalanine--D-glutamate ligase